MTVTLDQLSDFNYKVAENVYSLEFGGAAQNLNITNVWHKMTGEISGSSATLTIESVTPIPNESNFRYRIESPFEVINNENRPIFSLKIQNNQKGVPTLYAFIGSDDVDITKTTYAGSFIAISDLNNIYFTVENNTFKFYYQPIPATDG